MRTMLKVEVFFEIGYILLSLFLLNVFLLCDINSGLALVASSPAKDDRT